MAVLSSTKTKELSDLLPRHSKHHTLYRPLIQRILNISEERDAGTGNDSSRPLKFAVDALFYQRLRHILRIVISDIKSKEALMLVMHSSLLIARTAISLHVDGKIVASLVRAKSGEFDLNIIRWLLVAIPATSTNSWFDLALLYPYASLRNSQVLCVIRITALLNLERKSRL
ncbi:hypothetical protein FB446DRAFT_790513 [Lentinula raphanica]|nr:hypothetical protein FB446DRAFT_790513 [Lentinula raphanica]